MPKDNLQEIVDNIRAALKTHGGGGYWSIKHPLLEHPLELDVTPDGTTWFVSLKCGGRVLFDTGPTMSVEPEHFMFNLYVMFRKAIRILTTPPEKPS